MAVCCDLEVDVNGEETFLVDKRILTSYSGRLRKLFEKSSTTGSLKVIFNDFPGGAEGFELMCVFCYCNGETDITPYNICLLHCAAHFMEMRRSVSGNRGSSNLWEKTEKALEEINYWTWGELLVAMKQCQVFPAAASLSGITQRCLDCLVGKVMAVSETSPCPSSSSPDSSGIRFSCDTRSTDSIKNCFSRATWWFEDVSVFRADMMQMLIKSMVSRKFDHAIISRFLFFYQKSKFATASSDEKIQIAEAVIDMLYTLDHSSVSSKSLFGMLRVVLGLSISNGRRNKLESMIGCFLHQATLDNLLVPSPFGMSHLYDVDLVLRLVKAFLRGGVWQAFPERLTKVAGLMDLYIAEAAPDPCLNASRFLALIMALPDSARDSYDKIYHAMDMYLEVHAGLSEKEKMKICCALNYEKLSPETCIHLSRNKKIPSKSAVRALASQHIKVKTLLEGSERSKHYMDSPRRSLHLGCKEKKEEDREQIVLYAGKFDTPSDNDKIRAHLQGMQSRVLELEKICKKMQTQMARIMKTKEASSQSSNARSLPKLCS